jgi:hypothetical protein
MTRKDEVLAYLTDHIGQWVDGSDLANEKVGGSEGLRRLRELQEEGHRVSTRKHPDQSRDVWQYMLGPGVAKEIQWRCTKCKNEQADSLITDHAKSLTIADGYAHEYCQKCQTRQLFKRL